MSDQGIFLRPSRLIRVISVGLLLLTAGCFRPAGETVAPTEEAIGSEPVVADVTPTDLPTLAPPTDGAPALTLNPVELMPGEGQPTATAESPLGTTSGVESGLPITLIPMGSGADPVLPTATPQGVQVLMTLPNITLTPGFITPGVPLPITQDATSFIGTFGGTSTPSGLITPTSLPGTGDDCLYIIQSGDSLFAIALANGITLAELREVNPELVGEAPILQIGQQIFLPGCEGTPGPQAAPTIQAGGTILDSLPTSSAPLVNATPSPEGQIYTVAPGDSVYQIALRFGTTVDAIAQANNLSNPAAIQIGQRLIIPPAPDS